MSFQRYFVTKLFIEALKQSHSAIDATFVNVPIYKLLTY